MKFTKLFVLSLAVLFTFSLQAQEKAPASTAPVTLEKAAAPKMERQNNKAQQEAKRAERDAAIAERLEMTDAQAEQFYAINAKYRAQMQALRADNTQEREAMGQQMKAIREAREQELAGVLTPEQMEKLKANQQNMRKQGRGNGKVRPEGVPARRRVGGGK